MTDEKDFIRDKLMPFLIGLGVSIAVSIIYWAICAFAALLMAAGVFSSAVGYGNPAGAVFGALIGIPLICLAVIFAVAFGVLTTWLLGKWVQEKHKEYKQKRASADYKRAEYFAEKQREQQRQSKQEAEWEAEWKAMKQQESENSLSAKREKSDLSKSASMGSDTPQQELQTNAEQESQTPTTSAQEDKQ